MEKQEEQLITQGDEAELLLNNSAFDNLINNLVEGSFQTFVGTKPNDYEDREDAYNRYRALVDIVQTLRQRVAVRDEIQAKNSDNNSSEEE